MAEKGDRPISHVNQMRIFWSISVALVLAIALVLVSPFPRPILQSASGFGLLVGGVAVALACRYQAARSLDRRRRRAWILFGLAAVVGTVGNISLLSADMSLGPASLASLADACLVLALLIGVAATITFPSTPRRTAEIARIVMDGVIVGGSLLFFASVTLFPQIVGPSGDIAGRAVPLLVPVIDIVVATTALLLYLRRDTTDGSFLGLVSVGFALFSISDFSSAIVTVKGPFSFGSLPDIGWIAGYIVIAIAVRGAFNTKSNEPQGAREASPVLGTALMFTVFLVAAILNLTNEQKNALSTVSAVLWLLVLLGVVGRQLSLTLDNEGLRRGLEQRVIERSRDLRTVTQRSDLMLNSVGDGIYGVDREGMVTFVNPVGARTLGLAAEDLIGTNAHASFHAAAPNGEPYPEVNCYISEAITQGVVTAAESDAYLRADGGVVPVEVTASPTTNDGEPVGAVVVFRDITQRLEVDRMKDEFVSIVSHELKTPLTSIRGSLALLASGSLGELTPTAGRMATVALESTERLGRLINDILEVERIHSGVMPMDLAEHPAQSLIKAAIDQVGLLAEQADVRLEVGSVEGCVMADGDRAQQTLINLLDNAIKFSPAQSVVTVSTRPVGSYLEFAIEDSGRGIPPDKLDSVFKRFEQVDSSDARDRGGTGLGLAISRSIVERLGGRIWAENNAGRGATLKFTLPRTGSDELLRVAETPRIELPAPE